MANYSFNRIVIRGPLHTLGGLFSCCHEHPMGMADDIHRMRWETEDNRPVIVLSGSSRRRPPTETVVKMSKAFPGVSFSCLFVDEGFCYQGRVCVADGAITEDFNGPDDTGEESLEDAFKSAFDALAKGDPFMSAPLSETVPPSFLPVAKALEADDPEALLAAFPAFADESDGIPREKALKIDGSDPGARPCSPQTWAAAFDAPRCFSVSGRLLRADQGFLTTHYPRKGCEPIESPGLAGPACAIGLAPGCGSPFGGGGRTLALVCGDDELARACGGNLVMRIAVSMAAGDVPLETIASCPASGGVIQTCAAFPLSSKRPWRLDLGSIEAVLEKAFSSPESREAFGLALEALLTEPSNVGKGMRQGFFHDGREVDGACAMLLARVADTLPLSVSSNVLSSGILTDKEAALLSSLTLGRSTNKARKATRKPSV